MKNDSDSKKPYQPPPESGCKAFSFRIFSVLLKLLALCFTVVFVFQDASFSSGEEALEASIFNRQGGYEQNGVSAASTKSVTVLGTPFGIRLYTDGVIVASLSEIYTENGKCCPAADSGIRPGDYILRAGNREISHNSDLSSAISSSMGSTVVLTVRRDDSTFDVMVTPVFGSGGFKAGMWVRDSAAGIGTLTFYNAESGIFAGLGHGICDMDTSGVMTLKDGEPAEIAISSITSGTKDEPGKLNGYFTSDRSLGELKKNNETGIYGTLFEAPQGEVMAVAEKSEIRCGEAQLLLSLDSGPPKYYSAEIKKIDSKNSATKNLIVEITDPALIELTGGIVQGMSGSPIVQNGKLAGAVTHVFTNDPKTGYGIFAQTMLEQSSFS